MRTVSRTQADQVLAYIRSKAGLPYHFGGSGNPGGDCSWFAYAPAAMLAGLPPNKRYGSTDAYNVRATWEKPDARLGLVQAPNRAGVPADAILKLGFLHGGGGANSHVSGTFDGVNFESRGMYRGVSGHVVGGTARAWNDGLYHDFWYLPARVGAADPDAFPLPAGWYYGPLDGPEESVSGEAGEPAYQIDGIKRIQSKLGLPQTGKWRDAKAAIASLQALNPPLIPDGTVGPNTWALIMRHTSAQTPTPATPTEGPAVTTLDTRVRSAVDGSEHNLVDLLRYTNANAHRIEQKVDQMLALVASLQARAASGGTDTAAA